MLRDGVCDEVVNIARCHYDGGDCCKENKDRGLCRDCSCILVINQQDLGDQFKALEIKPVANPQDLEIAVGYKKNGWEVYVENVVSVEVCGVLCLDHKNADELNAWHYQIDDQICKCGWVESKSCPDKMVMDLESGPTGMDVATATKQHSAFVQLRKTVPCGKPICIKSGFFLPSKKQVFLYS